MKQLLVGALLLALSFPAVAQDNAQACNDTMDTAITAITDAGVTDYVILDGDAATAFVEMVRFNGINLPEGVTRVLRATFPDGVKVFGIEIGACLSPPLRDPTVEQPAPKAAA